MKPRSRNLVLLLLVIVLSMPFAAYWLADAWLESTGGRQMLEQELSRRLGMSVRLEGEFDLMLLPDIGVDGTVLLIGGEAGAPSLFSSFREFEISVALKPLLKRQVVVEWIRLTGGRVYPDRYRSATGADSNGSTRLPEVQELTLRDFEIVLPGENTPPLKLRSLEVSDFAPARPTPFTLEIEALVTASGWLLWDSAQPGIRFGDLQLDLSGQTLGGIACLLLNPWTLHADLQADELNMDALRDGLSGFESGSGSGSTELPLDLRVRLRLDRLHASGVVAEGVAISLGENPDCD